MTHVGLLYYILKMRRILFFFKFIDSNYSFNVLPIAFNHQADLNL